jgi:hypothetical protein
MLVGYRRVSAADPMGTSELLAAREKLHANPNDEALKRRIRELDLAVRQRYFNRLQRNQWGAWMLLLGGGVFVVAASRFITARQGMPLPARSLNRRPGVDRDLDWGRRSVSAAGIVVIVAMSAVALTRPRRRRVGSVPRATPRQLVAFSRLGWNGCHGFDQHPAHVERHDR